MRFHRFIKTIFFSLLTFLLGVQTTYAKTELVLPQNQTSFSIEQSQSFKSLEKQLQPNIGFLKEKYRFVILQSISAQNPYNFSERVSEYLAEAVGSFANQIDNTIARLTSKANISLAGTGKYKVVKGHHPMAKKAFEGDLAYKYKEAFSVSTAELDNAAGIANIHPSITGQQNSLYSAWKNVNPTKKLSLDEMADIEIQAMVNVGIPEDIATGWIIKSIEDLKLQGVTEIKNIPRNGVN